MKKRTISLCLIIIISLIFTNFCSIKKMAMNQVANALTAPDGGTVFTGDNDPELIAQALPFAIKMYESLMVSIPWHQGLRLKTGSMYIMFANAFIQTPSEMLPETQFDQQKFMFKRSKNLYLRGRDMLLEGLEKKYPGFLKKLNDKKYKEALNPTKKEDIPFLYWGALGWLGAFAIDPFDMKLGMTVPAASAMMERVAQLNPDYDNGSIYDFYITYYGSMPDYLGGDTKKARESFKKAVDVSHGQRTSPYLSLATSISIKEQNQKEFTELLNKVLEFDVDSDVPNRLLNVINQRKAQWYLDHADNFFVGASPNQTENPEGMQQPEQTNPQNDSAPKQEADQPK